ncbi:hypothetical protein [Streptomyces lacrimifluminis]|uniref:hypothetical protein n=1 Tax=Streptomyces lacrimifluminis TaxID=1500077 RepID=UPI001665AEB1|nr:hypothetical protein [Streptomyces lacrimifluminis]
MNAARLNLALDQQMRREGAEQGALGTGVGSYGTIATIQGMRHLPATTCLRPRLAEPVTDRRA